jgi:hypothetical protein
MDRLLLAFYKLSAAGDARFPAETMFGVELANITISGGLETCSRLEQAGCVATD